MKVFFWWQFLLPFDCAVGYNKFDFFKIKNIDPLKGAKFNIRQIYLICFLIFGAVFRAFGFKLWINTKMIKKCKKKTKKESKNAEVHADFKSVEN